ncbi:MAG: TetR/AcrR family transcriptional regulator [Rudaea sp.]|uniref:TetR/AcrR family transcriptional regulator n=1 Tax=Rudaea sp. TaxID=2136325 RepID=UPI0039E5D563
MEKKKTTTKGRAAATPRDRRAIGRPPAEIGGVGREGLIEKTCELLKIMPPASVTRAEVARYANVDPSLIRYYFRDRSALLVAATERLAARFKRMIEDTMKACGDDPEGLLRGRINALMDLIISYPFFHRLFVEELLAIGTPEGARLFRDLALRGVEGYRTVIAKGVRKGVLRDVDAGYLSLAIIGMTEFFVGGTAVLKVVRGGRIDQARAADEYREFVIDLILNGLRAPARAPGKGRKENIP